MFADLALLTERTLIFSPENFYSTVGFGFRIKNESLVVKTLNLRFIYFIRPPEGVRPWNLLIDSEDPEISQGLLGLKPEVVQYR
jgi:hypothetical protein